LIAYTTTLRQLNRKKQHAGKLSMQASCGNPGHLASLLDIPIEQDNLYDQQRQEHPYDSVSHNNTAQVSKLQAYNYSYQYYMNITCINVICKLK
jgi:hypothetical protein